MKRFTTILSLCLASSLLATAASAGVYVELVDHDIPANTTSPSQKLYVQGGNGRFVDTEGRATIIKNNVMYIVDDSDHTFVAFDKATMEQLAKQIGGAMEKAREQLAKLPPDQRAQMEQAMGLSTGDDATKKWEVEAVDTGKNDKVDGRACRVWDIKRNGELDDQVCVVPYASLPGKENFQVIFANFAKVFEEMAKSIPALAGMMNKEFDAQAKVKGFPVRSRAYDGGKLGDVEQLVKVWREEEVPASMFDIPAGYKPKKMAPPAE